MLKLFSTGYCGYLDINLYSHNIVLKKIPRNMSLFKKLKDSTRIIEEFRTKYNIPEDEMAIFVQKISNS